MSHVHMIEISLNGEPIQVPAGSLHALIANTNPPGQPVAAAINGEFVPRSQHQQTQLQDGDLVDLVSPVGGG